jgi:hypothetical protein
MTARRCAQYPLGWKPPVIAHFLPLCYARPTVWAVPAAIGAYSSMVDAAQSWCVLSTDVADSQIDGLAVSTQKGLLGLYGTDFLYCRRAWAEEMQPAYLARFSVDLGDAHEAALGSDDYTLMPAARRFDLGNYNFLGCAAADASMAQLLAYDIQEIERHVLGLSHRLAQGFLDLGLPVCGGAPGPHLAHIVAVSRPRTGWLHSTPNGDMISTGPAVTPAWCRHSGRSIRRAVETFKTPRHAHRGHVNGSPSVHPAVNHL